MQLFLGAVPIILRLFSKARGHLLFSNYSRNNLPKPIHVYIYVLCLYSVYVSILARVPIAIEPPLLYSSHELFVPLH